MFKRGPPELVPGGYAGPIKAHRHEPPSFTHRLIDWFIAVTLPATLFAGIVVMQGFAKTKTPRWVLWAVAAFFVLGNAAYELWRRKLDTALIFTMVVLCVAAIAQGLFTTPNGVVALVIFVALGAFVSGFRRSKLMMMLHAFLVFLACAAGTAAGLTVFYAHFSVAEQFHSLVTYVNIDPARDVGGAYRDSGEVYFKEGSRVDTARAIAVMSKDVYCAAPIVREETASAAESGEVHPPPSGTVDWWAVGKNCCDPSGEQFTCHLKKAGPGAVPRAGLRQLYAYERHLYRLAVDEWASKFELPVNHPLFFEWVVDPLADVTSHVLKGWQSVLTSIEAFTVANFILATFCTGVVVELLGG